MNKPDSSSIPVSVLFVEDDRDVANAARLVVERRGMTFGWAANPDEAWVALAQRPDVVLLDLNFSRAATDGAVGLELLAKLILHDPTLPIVVVTGHSGVATAVAAMRAGAVDFLIKPWRNERLVAAIANAASSGRRVATVEPADVPLLGDSPPIAAVRALIARVAPTRAAVFVHGEPGTGKSLVARLVHRASAASGELHLIQGRDSLGEAAAASVAAAAVASGGTLLIEDLDLVPIATQSRLEPLLGRVRTIVTSRLSPAALRAAASVRDDLLSRVSTVEIALPVLADRSGDALLLADYYLGIHAARHGLTARRLNAAAAAAIVADPWPDGVRGLAAACERAVVLGDGDHHVLAHFALSAAAVPGTVRTIARDFNLADSERALVAAALKRHAYNISRAADDLGVTRATLYRRMAKHGL